MSPIVSQMLNVLGILIQGQLIGTNLGLLHLMWMMVSGSLLPSRGALFPALQSIGLEDAEVRRAWAALRYGKWDYTTLLSNWETYVEEQGEWQPKKYDGYYAKAVDLTAFWRPKLKGLKSKHYYAQAGKALPAVVLGLIGRTGYVGEQRLSLLTDVLCADLDNPAEADFQAKVILKVADGLEEDEMPVFDAGFRIKELLGAGLERYLVRLAKNFTALRNYLPPANDLGRPLEYGEKVRPLDRTYNGKTIAATAPDYMEIWKQDGLEFRAEFWYDLVLPSTKPDPENSTFTVAAVYDPRFVDPLLLACPIKLSGPAFRSLYNDRWPIEQVPLAAKQMIGAHRQFVFASDSVKRLPELSLLAASVLTYQAAVSPPIPTGFWDRKPKRTPGRLRRHLAQVSFSDLPPLSGRIRKKASVTDHLPKGIRGHRRTKQAVPA